MPAYVRAGILSDILASPPPPPVSRLTAGARSLLAKSVCFEVKNCDCSD